MIYLIEVTYYDKVNEKIIDLLKIGYTNDLKKRFSQYISCNPEVQLLDNRPGGENLEKYLHKYFSKYKYPKLDEWFYYNDEIVDDFQLIDLPDPEKIEESDFINSVKNSGIKYINQIIYDIKDKYNSNNYPFKLDLKSLNNKFNVIWENCVCYIESMFKDSNICEEDRMLHIMFVELNLQDKINERDRIANTVIDAFNRNNEAGLLIAKNNFGGDYFIISDNNEVIKDKLSYYVEIEALESVKEYFNYKYDYDNKFNDYKSLTIIKKIIEDFNNNVYCMHSPILKFVLTIRDNYSKDILNKLILYIKKYKLGEETTTEISNYDSTKYFDMFPEGLHYYLSLDISDIDKLIEDYGDCCFSKYIEEVDKLVYTKNKLKGLE